MITISWRYALVASLLATAPALAHAATISVPGQYASIQSAINAASAGDTVVVADGTYNEHDLSMHGKSITLKSANGPVKCIIDAGKHSSVFTMDNGNETSTTVIQGFTLQNGLRKYGGGMQLVSSSPYVRNCVFADNSSTSTDNADQGGGFFLNSSSPTFDSCTFSSNVSSIDYSSLGYGYGGAGSMLNSSPSFINCTFQNNTAGEGGALYCSGGSMQITGCSFGGSNSSAHTGGAIYATNSTVTLTNCALTGQSAEYGSAIHADNGTLNLTGCTISSNVAGAFSTVDVDPMCNLTASHCTFDHNTALSGAGIGLGLGTLTLSDCVFSKNSGGAVDVNQDTLSTITRCTFIGNTASGEGSALSMNGGPVITNCIFEGNGSTEPSGEISGAAIEILNGGTGAYPIFANCTFFANTNIKPGGTVIDVYQAYAEFTNCILWDGPSITEISDPKNVTATTCDIFDAAFAGTSGNLAVDPIFESATAPLDLHIVPNSPCAATGTTSATTPQVDADNRTRPSTPSIGAYEPNEATTTTLTSSANPAATGQSVTVTATISATDAPQGGTVAFTVDGSSSGTFALSDGQVAVTLSGLADGTHTVTAAYSGISYWQGSKSDTLTQLVGISLPSAPANLTGLAGNASVSLLWPAVSGASGYNVYRSSASGSGYAKLNTAGPATTTSYKDVKLTYGAMYYYVVTAVNASGESAYSTELAMMPLCAPVASLSATAGNGSVTLNWPAATAAKSYTVYRATGSGSSATHYAKIGSASGSAVTYTDTTAANGPTYSYYLTTVNAAGSQSAASAAASATPLSTILAGPAGVKATPQDGSVSLAWGSVSGASSYNVYYSADGGQSFGLFATTSSRVSVVAPLTNGSLYYFRVTALVSGTVTAPSATVSCSPVAGRTLAIVGHPVAHAISAGLETIAWDTNTLANASVLYGASASSLTGAAKTSTMATGHKVSLTGLTSGQTYYYQCVSEDGVSKVNSTVASFVAP